LKKHVLYIIFLLLPFIEIAQLDQSFTLKGSVKIKETGAPIGNINIYIVGKGDTRTNIYGEFEVTANIGDKIIFSGVEIESVSYVIIDRQYIEVLVEEYRPSTPSRSNKRISKKDKEYNIFIDSANYYKTKDIDKSLEFIEKSLTTIKDKEKKEQRALSYYVLGDIYLHWKQYDLATINYQKSYETRPSVATNIKLGKAYFLNKEYVKSKEVFDAINRAGRLSVFEEISVLEGLGDANNQLNEFSNAIFNYNKALKFAKANLVTPKITDLTSKLAEVYAKTNDVDKAEGFFNNSLSLAEKENPKRAIQEESKVADFLNKKNLYDKEIELRKSTLQNVKKFKKENNENVDDVVGVLTDTITPQKINYKIGNAFVAQDKFKEAIPYLEESIAEANREEDLIVKKDATRKLSEVYESVGDYTRALESYQDYVQLVDELYIKKEQEISQITRFSRDITLKQNRISSLEKDRKLSETQYNLALKDRALVEESNKRQQIIIYSLIFGMLMLTLIAVLFYRTNKQQQLANNLLALKSLRSQMNPHFIFNALNSVNNFIAKSDERSANQYLSEFSTLMRSVLENSEESFIPLQKEVELLELYTKLEHSRFKEKFDYEINIDEKIKMTAFEIPPMLLQPYVENAIWHGLRYKEAKGWLKINFHQMNKTYIKITIEDNGVGRKQSAILKTSHQRKQKSKGMGNIKRRIAILNNMYKDRIGIRIEDMFEDETGTRVVLTLKRG